HDGGLCPDGRAARRPVIARSHLPGLPGALSPHHDDDDFCAVWRLAAGAGVGRGGRDASAAGADHRWRADPEPDADTLHNASGVLVFGSLPLVGPALAGRRRLATGIEVPG